MNKEFAFEKKIQVDITYNSILRWKIEVLENMVYGYALML